MGGMFDIMHVVDRCLMGSIGQAVTDAGWTELWTNQTMAKNALWTTGISSEIPFNDSELTNDPKKVADWIQKYYGGNDANGVPNMMHWSSAAVLKLQAMVAGWYQKGDWDAVQGAVGAMSGAVSAQATEDTTTGQTEGKNAQSQLQTDNTALQPISDFGSAYAQFLSALANVMSQVGPGA